MIESFTGGKERIANLKDIFNNELDKILATPQTPEFHIEGFVINGKLSETIEQKAEVTTNPVESGVTISDHIFVQPVSITISGEISDIEFLPKDPEQNAINKTTNKTTNIPTPFLPQRTAFQENTIKSQTSEVDRYIDTATQSAKKGLPIYQLLNTSINENTMTRQKAFTAFFSMLMNARTPITLATKNKEWLNMALIGFSETSEQDSFLGFSFTFQELKFAQTQMLKTEQIKNPAKEVQPQTDKQANTGQQNEKEEKTESFLYRLFGWFQGLDANGKRVK
ncbi:MAG: hypothetical protein LBG21_02945 [Campylobacteraceae bacterium]|jgi:hypothetical protein|nr:hypothetical protein [Campylobacteraceae bacterium]